MWVLVVAVLVPLLGCVVVGEQEQQHQRLPDVEGTSFEAMSRMRVAELRAFLRLRGLDRLADAATERRDLVQVCFDNRAAPLAPVAAFDPLDVLRAAGLELEVQGEGRLTEEEAEVLLAAKVRSDALWASARAGLKVTLPLREPGVDPLLRRDSGNSHQDADVRDDAGADEL